LKPRLHKQNPDGVRVEEEQLKLRYFLQKTGRLKPRLHKQNPPTRVEEDRAIEITLFSSEDRAVETASTQTKPADAG